MAKKKKSGERKAGKRGRRAFHLQVPEIIFTVPIVVDGRDSDAGWAGYVRVTPPFRDLEASYRVTVYWSSELQRMKGKGKKEILDVVPGIDTELSKLKFFGAARTGLVSAFVKFGKVRFAGSTLARKGH